MKKYTYLVSFFIMSMFFAGVFLFTYFKVSGSKYEEILERKAHGLPGVRQVTMAVRVKPNRSKEQLEDVLQYTYANELMDQVHKKQTLKSIVIRAYTSAIDFQKNPDSSWRARLEKTGEEDEKIIFPAEGQIK